MTTNDTAITAAVHEAMRSILPDRYTTALADAIAADTITRLAPTETACPDGIAWCLGDPANHADPREHRHEGPEYGLTGSYIQGTLTKSIATFHIDQWDDGELHLVFESDGTWPDLGLTQVDELIADAVPWLAQLIATRRRIAIELKPGRTPFMETENAQTATAAFELATAAMQIAVDKAEDQTAMLAAMRVWLRLAEDEARA